MVDIKQQLKRFLGKIISNPITLGIVMYLMWQILSRYVKKENIEDDNMKEDFEKVDEKGNKELVYDKRQRIWAVIINGRDTKIFGRDERAARKFFGESYSEKLQRLKENICLKE